MAGIKSRSASVSESEILRIKKDAVPKKYKERFEIWSESFQRREKTYRRSTLAITDLNNVSMVNNGNRTEWNPIRSVIIRVINKIGRQRSGSRIC